MRSNLPARRPSRLVVSFSGLDGAGKSRQIDALLREIDRRGRAEVLWLPFKMWPEPLVTRLPVSFRNDNRPTQPRGSASNVAGQRKRARPLRRLARTTIGVAAAISTGVSLRRRAASSNAELLVLDRYRIDSIVKLQYWYPDVPASALAGVVTALAPAPDLEIYLRVDPDVAYARKREDWTPEQLDRQARLYDRVAAHLPSVLVLDGHGEPNAVADAVRGAVGALRGR